MPSARAKGRVGAGYLKGRRSEITVVRKQWGITGKVALVQNANIGWLSIPPNHFSRMFCSHCPPPKPGRAGLAEWSNDAASAPAIGRSRVRFLERNTLFPSARSYSRNPVYNDAVNRPPLISSHPNNATNLMYVRW